MNQKITEYLNNLVDECTKSDSFSQLPDDQKRENGEKIADYFNQVITDSLLSYMTKDELDQLEDINFESEEGVQKFGEIASSLPGFVFLEIGDKLRQEAETIKKTGAIPQ
jgi:hypothetical protein